MPDQEIDQNIASPPITRLPRSTDSAYVIVRQRLGCVYVAGFPLGRRLGYDGRVVPILKAEGLGTVELIGDKVGRRLDGLTQGAEEALARLVLEDEAPAGVDQQRLLGVVDLVCHDLAVPERRGRVLRGSVTLGRRVPIGGEGGPTA